MFWSNAMTEKELIQHKCDVYDTLVEKFIDLMNNEIDDIPNMEYDDEGHKVYYTKDDKAEYAVENILRKKIEDTSLTEDLVWYLSKTLFDVEPPYQNNWFME